MNRLRFCISTLVVCLVAISCSGEPGAVDTVAPVETDTTLSPGAEPWSALEGAWLGSIVPGARIQIRLEGGAAGLTGVLDSIDDGVMGLPLDSVAASGTDLEIRADTVEAVGVFKLEQDRLEGTIAFGDEEFDISLVLQDEPFAYHRPQEPTGPFPYTAEEAVFTGGDASIDLAGTLTIPQGTGPFPAVVLISGSGPQDRDGQLAGHKPFLVLADHLTRAGIAVLRYDDRGYGQSGGTLDGTSEDLAADAAAALAFLAGRPETATTGLIGHSEGGLIAPIGAAANPETAFIVMLAGPGEIGAEILAAQTRLILEAEGTPAAIIDWQMGFVTEAIAASASDLSDAALREELDAIAADAVVSAPAILAGSVTHEGLASALEAYTEPWMRYFLRYDPAPALRSLTIPVLALFGENDLQVPATSNAAAVEAALDGGHPSSRIETIAGVNHLFQHSAIGAVSEYITLTETIDPGVLDLVTEWILGIAG